MNVFQSPNFLRNVLFVDAAASGATALLTLGGAAMVSRLTNLPEMLLMGAGLALLPFVAFVLFVATRGELPRLGVQAVAEINFLWTLASFALLFGGLVQPNALGVAFIAGQALAVAALGVAQVAALGRRARHA